MKNKVVLFYPKTGWDIKNVTVCLPLSLIYLGTVLKNKGYDVKIIDSRIDGNYQNTLAQEIKYRPLCVGVSSMTGYQIKGGIEASKICKESQDKIPVIWGGVHPTLLPEQTLENRYVDIVVRKDGEETILELVDALNNNNSLKGIKGISYKNDNVVIHNEDRNFVDLDKLPKISYDLVNIKDYITTQVLGEEDIMLSTSRGCPHDCSFCSNISYNRFWRWHSAERIFEDINYFYKNYNIHNFTFNEDNFFVNKKRVEKLCALIEEEKLNIKMRASCKIEYLEGYDVDFLKYLRKNGFAQLFVGVETGSEKILKEINKKINCEGILKVNKKLKDVNIAPTYDFMGGFPQEKKRDMEGTLNLMLRLIKDNPYAHITAIRLCTPYPGTEIFRLSTEKGWKSPQHLEEWSNFHWNNIEFQWLTRNEINTYKKISYATYFLDGKTVLEYYSKSFIVKLIAKLYTPIVKFRCKFNFWKFMPEIKVLQLLKRIIT